MYRFFKCNILGGFRLSDLNRNIRQGEYFFVECSFCDTSRAVRVAIQNKWMTEVSEKEASQYITIPKWAASNEAKISEVAPRKIVRTFNQLAIPDVKDTNESLESRQARKVLIKQPMQKQKQDDKPIGPNFNEAERAMKARQADIMTKGPDEVLQSPVESRNDTVKDIAKEIADNSMLATPNFDERKAESGKSSSISQEIEKRVRRRRKAEEVSTVPVTSEV